MASNRSPTSNGRNSAANECSECKTRFSRRKQKVIHQQINPPCLKAAGRCYYFDYCKFESNDLMKLKEHLAFSVNLHLEYLTDKLKEIEYAAETNEESFVAELKKAAMTKVNPLEKLIAEIALNLRQFKEDLSKSEIIGGELVDMLSTVARCSQIADSAKEKIPNLATRMNDSEEERNRMFNIFVQQLNYQGKKIAEVGDILQEVQFGSSCGTLIWKIKDYKSLLHDSKNGKDTARYSVPFYTSKYGYKLCLRADLNGNGVGKGKYLSVFSVLMKGIFDDLLTFPFMRQVTFSLLCPSDFSRSIHLTIKPQADMPQFKRPVTSMNIGNGVPQFASLQDIESNGFIVDDCIYLRLRVEPGDDDTPF